MKMVQSSTAADVGTSITSRDYNRASKMSLTPGTRLGPYEIITPIGAEA
jgi:hypothetical protein